jgi:transposase-like protein
VGRRGIKEYRAAEALLLISADRGIQELVCPTCSKPSVERSPRRNGGDPSGRVTLKCSDCGRSASYIDRVAAHEISPEAPRIAGV